MDEQHSKVAVASLADTEQRWLASSRVLARYQTEPCGEFAAFAEHRTVTNGRDQSSGTQRAYSRHRHKTAAVITAPRDQLDVTGRLRNLCFEGVPMIPQPRDQLAHARREAVLRVFEDRWQIATQ